MGLAFLLLAFMLMFGLVNANFLREGEITTGHPDHIEDVAQAYKWTRDHIRAYQGDPDRIFVMGHSAGGHLATLLALDSSYLEKLGESPDSIKGVIAISGVYNFGRLKKTGLGFYFYIVPLLRNNSELNDGELKKELYSLSPLTFVRRTPISFFFLNASIDFHLQRDAEEIANALKLLGVEVKHLAGVHNNHGSIIHCMDTPQDTVSPLIINWIDGILNRV